MAVGASPTWRVIEGSGGDLQLHHPEIGREQIFVALAELIAERGFRDVSSTDVIRRSGILAEDFYASFMDMEDCFLEAYDAAIGEALRRVSDAGSEAQGDWPQQVFAALSSFLSYVAENPTMARMCLVETLGAGPAAVTRYEETVERFVPLFRLGRAGTDHGHRLPQTMEETMVGGLFWLIHDKIINREVERIESLLPELTQFVLTPYIGRVEAAEFVREHCASHT